MDLRSREVLEGEARSALVVVVVHRICWNSFGWADSSSAQRKVIERAKPKVDCAVAIAEVLSDGPIAGIYQMRCVRCGQKRSKTSEINTDAPEMSWNLYA